MIFIYIFLLLGVAFKSYTFASLESSPEPFDPFLRSEAVAPDPQAKQQDQVHQSRVTLMHSVNNIDDLNNAIADGARIELTGDIELDGVSVLFHRVSSVYLNGNGFKIIDTVAWQNVSCVILNKATNITLFDVNIGQCGEVSDDVSGGGILVDQSTLVLASSNIENCSAHNGGGLYASSSEIEIINSHLISNLATHSGGGIYASGDSLVNIHQSSSVSNNFAHKIGGGILARTGSTINMTGSWVEANHVETYVGAGVCLLVNSALLMSRSTVSFNHALYYDGGGIFASASYVHISESVISNNTVDIYSLGGGIAAWLGSSVTVVSSIISHNTADADGGGIYMDDSELTLIGSHVHNNTARWYGGGIFGIFSDIYIVSTIFSFNEAQDGGGLAFESCSSIDIFDSEVSSNFAKYGGGLLIDSCDAFYTTSVSIANNLASGAGGGMYLWESSDSIIFDCQLTHNVAGVNGGGIVFNSCENMLVEYSELIRNEAVNGGGLYMFGGDGSVFVYASQVYRNTITTLGGGAYVLAGSLYFYYSLLESNEAISPTFSSSTWKCSTYGGCVTSPNYPQNYDDDIDCAIWPSGSGVLDVTSFHVQAGSGSNSKTSSSETGDKLEIQFSNNAETKSYTGVNGPQGVSVAEGDVMRWKTDDTDDTDAGFKICFSTAGKGGGVYSGGGYVGLYFTNVSNNEATRFGGGLYGDIDSSFSLLASEISNNVAGSGEGSEVYLAGGEFDAKQLTIQDYSQESIGGEGSCCATCASSCTDNQVQGTCKRYKSNAPNCYVNCECTDCDPGFEPSSDNTACNKCTAGKASEFGRKCLVCQPGQYAKVTQTTVSATSSPTSVPTHVPIPAPTFVVPSPVPTNMSSSSREISPTGTPTPLPTSHPTHSPSNHPSVAPSSSFSPSTASISTPLPTVVPRPGPTLAPTASLLPIPIPTYGPTHSPTMIPSHSPTNFPTTSPQPTV